MMGFFKLSGTLPALVLSGVPRAVRGSERLLTAEGNRSAVTYAETSSLSNVDPIAVFSALRTLPSILETYLERSEDVAHLVYASEDSDEGEESNLWGASIGAVGTVDVLHPSAIGKTSSSLVAEAGGAAPAAFSTEKYQFSGADRTKTPNGNKLMPPTPAPAVPIAPLNLRQPLPVVLEQMGRELGRRLFHESLVAREASDAPASIIERLQALPIARYSAGGGTGGSGSAARGGGGAAGSAARDAAGGAAGGSTAVWERLGVPAPWFPPPWSPEFLPGLPPLFPEPAFLRDGFLDAVLDVVMNAGFSREGEGGVGGDGSYALRVENAAASAASTAGSGHGRSAAVVAADRRAAAAEVWFLAAVVTGVVEAVEGVFRGEPVTGLVNFGRTVTLGGLRAMEAFVDAIGRTVAEAIPAFKRLLGLPSL